MKPKPDRDLVAVILAIGLATALNVITAAVLIDALFSDGPGLSENATQLLTAGFSGVVGVLGGYIGGRAVARGQRTPDERNPDDPASQ